MSRCARTRDGRTLEICMWNIDVADEHGCGQLQHDAAKGGTLDWQLACARYSRSRGRGGRRARGGPGRASARPGWRPSMQCAKSTCRTPFWDRSMGAGCPAHPRVPPRVSQSSELYKAVLSTVSVTAAACAVEPVHDSMNLVARTAVWKNHSRRARRPRLDPRTSLKRGSKTRKILPRQRVANSLPLGIWVMICPDCSHKVQRARKGGRTSRGWSHTPRRRSLYANYQDL